MLERATICVNRGGLSTLPSRLTSCRGAITKPFWHHGAGDIEPADWWHEYLHTASNCRKPVRSHATSQEPLKSLFLDFLHPPKTTAIAQRVIIGPSQALAGGRKRFTLSRRRRKDEQDESQRHDRQDESFEHNPDFVAVPSDPAKQETAGKSKYTDLGGQSLQAETDPYMSVIYDAAPSDREPPAAEIDDLTDWVRASDAEEYEAIPTTMDDPVPREADSEVPSRTIVETDVLPKSIYGLRFSHSEEEPNADELRVPHSAEDTDADTDRRNRRKIDRQRRLNPSETASILYWSKKSKELAEARESYLNAVKLAYADPDVKEDFRNSHVYEVPRIKDILYGAYDSGITFLNLYVEYVYTNVLPHDRSKWTEKQWAFALLLTLQHPDSNTILQGRLDLVDNTFPTGQEGALILLKEALAQGKASLAIQEVTRAAFHSRRFGFIGNIVILLRAQDVPIDTIFSFANDLEQPDLMHGVKRGLSFYKWCHAPSIRHDKTAVTGEQYKDNFRNIINELARNILKQGLSSDIVVADYERLWMVFQTYEGLKDEHFVTAINQLLAVESKDPFDTSAFVFLAYKLFRIARLRRQISWSEEQVRTLLEGMTAVQHPQCWEVYNFYRLTFGLKVSVCKAILTELSRSGDVIHWQEAYRDVQSGMFVSKRRWSLQLLQAYAKQGDVTSCANLLAAIETRENKPADADFYNCLLQAYERADDFSGFLELYRAMQKRGISNNRDTDVVILEAFARRGELSLTTYQITEIRNKGRPMDAFKLECLLRCHAELRDWRAAEKVFHEAFSLSRDIVRTTAMNIMMALHAHLGRMEDVMYYHDLMQQHGFKEDHETFYALMQAFIYTGRPSAAWRMLIRTIAARNMAPTIRHYNIIMEGFLYTKEYDMVLKMYSVVRKQYLQPNFDTWSIVVRATSKMFDRAILNDSGHIAASKQAMANAKELLSQILEENKRNDNGESPVAGMGEFHLKAEQYLLNMGFELSIRQQMTTGTPDLIAEYQSFLHQQSAYQKMEPSMRVFGAIAQNYLEAGRIDEVTKVWLTAQRLHIKKAIRTNADPRQAGWVLPGRSLDLNHLFGMRMSQLIAQEKYLLLKQEVENFANAGWRMSSMLWNKYILHLCERNDTFAAFRICEQHLISGFPGWPPKWRESLPLTQTIEPKEYGPVADRQVRPRYATLRKLAELFKTYVEGCAFLPDGDVSVAELHKMAPRTVDVVLRLPLLGELNPESPFWATVPENRVFRKMS